ncbi:SusC/RagA family TonB-linked outer membrane protein [Bacteroides caecigallinarum]|uniref:SusC/RagA family TonB-linked outer membrane protein n=1 Tax=Bacteroides caecigallinarum TaxID=1411144 RepID=UPI00195B846E|nr:SusC/RagA family TonB-linked outer membrane protein [Bacteroides caecigallinarum]MBM6865608.1 SusC/RagA family TonB-linked outer membrane protein [Bacteroides caecigallinarum]
MVVSFIGMETQEVKIKPVVNVVLRSDAEMLDEVMVVAYGTSKRSAFTGSATEMKSKDLEMHTVSSATNALSGKVAGVQMTSSSGEPGSSSTIRIRGIGSMNASSEPLYVVDGAPYDGGIANINPQDIESISVLKDAAASAIYGARGANGVVIITTKKAKANQDAVVKLDAKWGVNSRLIPQYDVITDPAQYYETHYKALYNSQYYNGKTSEESYAFADKNLFDKNNGGLGYQVYTVPEGESLIGRDFRLNPNATLGYSDGTYYYTPDNWYDETYHNSFRQEYNLSVSGNRDRLNYYASAGYLDDGGFVNNSRYQRYTARTNVDFQAKKWLKLITNLSFSHVDSQSPSFSADTYASSGNLFYIVNTIAPIYPLYVRNADGSIKTEGGRTVYDSNQTNFVRPSIVGNAVRDNEYDSRQTYRDVFNGTWSAVITPIEGLNLTATLSAMSYNTRSNELSSIFGSGVASGGIATVSNSRTFTVNQQYIANYTKTFADIHNFTALAGYEQYNYKYQYHRGENDHLYTPNIGELGNAYGIDSKKLDSYTDNYMTEGFLGRVQYDYDNKYFTSVSYRRDASSVFAPGHRWGSFGSVGLAWQMNKEEFLNGQDWIDLLKMKLSYGVQGNDAILDQDGYRSYYAYSDRYQPSYNKDTGDYSVVLSQKGNNELTWESSYSWNAGVDFSFFGYRLNGTIDYYNRKTVDMLYFKTLPLSGGINVATFPANIGSMRNSGIEVSLDGVIIKNRNLEWALNLNFTHNKNIILELDPSIGEEGLTYSNRVIKEGGSIYQAYMLKYAGTDKETGKALYYMDKEIVDEAGNKQIERTTTEDITKATKYDCGTTLPKLYGGFGTTLNAYGFDLSLQFSYQLGGQIYDGVYQSLMHNGLSAGSNMHKDLLNAWSPDNKNSDIPRLSAASTDDPGVKSQTPIDRFLTSSDYLSLNNLTLGYTIPKNILNKLKINNLRVYVSGENLFLLTARKGLDPRFNYGIGSMTSGAGLASGSYASMRTITGGLSFTF